MRASRFAFLFVLLPLIATAKPMDSMGMAEGDAMPMDHAMEMTGTLGNYPMQRDGSGTSWQPDSTPMAGIHGTHGDWSTMVHGYVDGVYDQQGGPRGQSETFSQSMLMGMASRPVGDGTLGLRAMLSLDPLMGKSGYPLLLQTGETANGTTPLIDRQHPHDLFMELATTYSHPAGPGSAFVYLGYPSEPALGPVTFMHRWSGMLNPEAPIDHHWLDSTHISYGVATVGYAWQAWKLETSAFNGREPDEQRWNFDGARFDSYSARLSYNPTANWALQVSAGELKSPEQLTPDQDQTRVTASATYNLPRGADNWQTTAAWGRDSNSPGRVLDAFLLESAYRLGESHHFFGRAERAEKDELFDSGPLVGRGFEVNKFSLGYFYDLPVVDHARVGVGAVGSLYALPGALDDAYGEHPASFMLFARASLY